MPTEHEDWISSYEAHEPKSSPRLAVVEAAEWVSTTPPLDNLKPPSFRLNGKEPSLVHCYVDEHGAPIGYICRYEGKPATVPLYFLAHQLFEHGTHHRGQVSQILDELGVEHDFCGIGIENLPR